MDTVKTERVKTTMPLPFFAHGRAVKCWDHGHAYTVARIDPNDKFTAESRPDFAEYIATACNLYRDLLAACNAALAYLDAEDSAGLVAEIAAAVAKAEGRTL